MSQILVRRAFEKRLDTLTPAVATVFENVEYVPVSGTPYQQARLLPATPENPVYGDGYYREVGLFQVGLFYPLNVGVAVVQTRAEALRTLFPRATYMTEGGVTTTIRRTPAISSGFVDGDRYVLFVSIDYFASVF